MAPGIVVKQEPMGYDEEDDEYDENEEEDEDSTADKMSSFEVF